MSIQILLKPLNEFKTRILVLVLLGSILIFIPLTLVLKAFTENAANELVNNWLQSEYVSLQQGQVLQSVLKLERTIKDSSLMQSVVVFNENDKALIEIGKKVDRAKKFSSTQILQVEEGSWLSLKTAGKRIYHLKINQLTLLIVTGSPLLLYIALGMIFYLVLILSTFYHIFKRQWIQEEKQRSEQRLKELTIKNEYDKKLSQLGRQFAHDIRSPLSALKMIYQDLEIGSQVFKDNEKFSNFLLVPDIILRLETISNKVLSLKFQENDQEQKSDKKNQFLIRKENIVELLERVIAEKKIEFQNQYTIKIQLSKSDSNIFVEIDRVEFMRAVSNLINNAIEASSHLDIIIINVEVIKNVSNSLTLMIEDLGKGLTSETILFLKSHNSSIGKKGGHGLGLLHLKEFLKHHHGDFEIVSDPNVKTQIRINLPRLSDEFYHIVHVDDESIVRLLWKRRANEKGLSLLSLSSPHEIFDFLEHINPAKTVIYCDYFFPNSSESGVQTLSRLKEMGYEKLFLSSGINSQNEIENELPFKNVGKIFPNLEKETLR